jgi:hypothetical protein
MLVFSLTHREATPRFGRGVAILITKRSVPSRTEESAHTVYFFFFSAVIAFRTSP